MEQAEQEKDERYRAFWKAEKEHDLAIKEELDQADIESMANVGYEVPQPNGSAADAEEEILIRRIDANMAAAARDREILRSRRDLMNAQAYARAQAQPSPRGTASDPIFLSSSPVKVEDPLRSSPGAYPLQHSSPFQGGPAPSPDPRDVVWVDGSSKKINPPKPWTGIINHRLREEFISTADAYLSAHGIIEGIWMSRRSTPANFYRIQALFDSTPSLPGAISPHTWFENWVRTYKPDHAPFSKDPVFWAMRQQWPDHQAAEKAFEEFRFAKQGSSSVVAFGTRLQALAANCWVAPSPAEIAANFEYGLNDPVRTHLKLLKTNHRVTFQIANQGALPVFTFQLLFELASSWDDIYGGLARSPRGSSQRAESSPAPLTPSSRPPRYTTNSPSSPTPGPSSSSQASSDWVTQALDFQEKNKMSDKSKWFNDRTRSLSSPVRCWNCGKMGTHVSVACPNKRVDPKQVVLSAVKVSSSVPPSPSAPSPLSNSIVELSSDESGNGSDEEN